MRLNGNLASSRSKCLLPPAANLSVRPCKRSAARSRPLAEGCHSPEGSFVPPLGCGLCDRSRSRKGSAGRPVTTGFCIGGALADCRVSSHATGFDPIWDRRAEASARLRPAFRIRIMRAPQASTRANMRAIARRAAASPRFRSASCLRSLRPSASCLSNTIRSFPRHPRRMPLRASFLPPPYAPPRCFFRSCAKKTARLLPVTEK